MKAKKTPRNVLTKRHVKPAHYQWTTCEGITVRGFTIADLPPRCQIRAELRKIYA
jgi:hypothetical protein